MYRRLDAARIESTAVALARRVDERFPGSGLSKVAAELVGVVQEAQRRCAWVAEPKLLLRVGLGLIVLALISIVAASLATIEIRGGELTWPELVQVSEAGINDVVLLGLALLFLFSIEKRMKRKRALAGLHELRAMAHVIDMHQLTKDPERLTPQGPDTASSPKQVLTAFELTRYLDYCSEMLALIGKSAALYGQYLDDEVVLAAVTEIEGLTAGLSNKIWHKINAVELYRQRHGLV